MESSVIDIQHVTHRFGEKEVLKGMNLTVGKGEIFGLLGPSGAGKTTLMKIITGQLKQSAGKAMLLGKETCQLKGNDYLQIGMMMDNLGLYERMSCYDNLAFLAELNGLSKNNIENTLEKVGLKNAKRTQVSNLSKGMKNRLALARACFTEPQILFLDEPTSGLDPMTTSVIHDFILKEKEKGTTILLTTHNMAEAEKLCDTIAWLNEGKIVESGAPKEICRKYNHQKKILVHLYDGTDLVLPHEKCGVQTMLKYMEKEQIETIHTTEPNLETVFMELTGRKLEEMEVVSNETL